MNRLQSLRVCFVLILISALSLAGCLTPESDEQDEEATEEPVVEKAPLRERFSLDDCSESLLMFLVEPATAQKALPEGFEAADAQDWLGTPFETGKSMVVATAARCESATIAQGPYDESYVAVTIEPPDIDGDRTGAVNLYIVSAATGNADMQARYDEFGWATFGTQVTLESSYDPPVTGQGAVADEQGEVFSFESTGPWTPMPIEGTYRWWHASDLGVSYVDYEMDFETHLGRLTCDFRSGSIVPETAQETECTAANSLGATNNPFDAEGEWNFLGRV